MLTPKTSVRCLMRPLSAIAHLQKIHILPVRATLPRVLNPETKQMEPKMLDPNEIFQEYIRPWITGEGSHSNGSAAAASAAASSSAASSSSSSSSTAGAASSSSSASASAEHEPKHVVEGDLFVSRGVQFKVVSCLPLNGIITNATEIFSAGPALEDVAKLQIQPIFEGLPNSEKAWTGAQIFQKYLLPYFQGRARFVKYNDRIEIDGVEFVVLACEPTAGIVTVNTLIFNEGPPLRAEDLRRRQLEDDEAMARQMQQAEEQANRPQMMMRGGRHMVVQSPAELQARLAQVLRLMPPDDPHRQVVQRLYEQLGQLPPGAQLHNADRGMLGLLRASAAAEQNRGASAADIEALPTRIYHAPAASSNQKTNGEVEKERNTCMVRQTMRVFEGDRWRDRPAAGCSLRFFPFSFVCFQGLPDGI